MSAVTPASFTVNTYADTEGVYLGIAKDCASFGTFLTPEDVNRLKEVLESATK